MLVEDLSKKFGTCKPIFASEILKEYPNFSKQYLYRLIKREIAAKKLHSFKRGVYYLTESTKFGNVGLCPEDIASKKYLYNEKETFGTYTGLSLLNKFNITAQVPFTTFIVTNKETSRKRQVQIGGMPFVLKKSRCEITKENCAAYTVLELFSSLDKDDKINKWSLEIIKNYMKAHKTSIADIQKLLKFFPGKTIKRFLGSELYNETLQ